MKNTHSPSKENRVVLDLNKLEVFYNTEEGPLATVRDVSITFYKGQIYGLVGESGSGKTTLARAIVRYLPRNGKISGGNILLNGTNLLNLSPKEMRRVWGSKITMVHQNPSEAVNPSIPVGEQIAEVARAHLGMSRKAARRESLEMLNKLQIADPESVSKRYAHQLSGGLLQRIVIASALVTNPQLLILDEPTTALDVTTEVVILDLIRNLLEEYETSVLYITHNLGVAAQICDRIGVMYAGELVEEGTTQEIFTKSLHPYCIGLLGCVPRIDLSKHKINLSTIPGHIPQPDELPNGCIFSPRCPIAQDKCLQEHPPLIEAYHEHFTSCIRWKEIKHGTSLFHAQEKIINDATKMDEVLVLDARNIKKYFQVERGFASLFGKVPSFLHAVDDISIRNHRSSTVGMVGESGCGKTTFARCIAGLEKPTAGEIMLGENRLAKTVDERPPELLRKIQMVFQNPDASLNPQHTVGESVSRPLFLLGNLSREEIEKQLKGLFKAVNLPEDYLHRLPHELSGGEKQRVAIARAFSAKPSLVILDEPISSLDVSVQASIMNLLVKLQESEESSYLFISHDLAAVRYLSDQIAVIYLGQLVEFGLANEVFAPPSHPYTEALVSAIPALHHDTKIEPIRLYGSLPSAVNIPAGCRFHTRCPRIIGKICEAEKPPWQVDNDDHFIRCHIPLEDLQDKLQLDNNNRYNSKKALQ